MSLDSMLAKWMGTYLATQTVIESAMHLGETSEKQTELLLVKRLAVPLETWSD